MPLNSSEALGQSDVLPPDLYYALVCHKPRRVRKHVAVVRLLFNQVRAHFKGLAVDAAPLHLCRELLMGSNPLHYDRLDVGVTLLFFVRTGMRMALYVRIFVLHGN
jgi:hypothetical protein